MARVWWPDLAENRGRADLLDPVDVRRSDERERALRVGVLARELEDRATHVRNLALSAQIQLRRSNGAAEVSRDRPSRPLLPPSATTALILEEVDRMQKTIGLVRSLYGDPVDGGAAQSAEGAAPRTRTTRPRGPVSHARDETILASIRELSGREVQVLDGVILGKSSRCIGQELGIHEKTVENHRAALNRRFGARNAAHLTSLVLLAGYTPRAGDGSPRAGGSR